MDNISLSNAELLKYAIENGIINPALVQEQIEMQKRKELLEKHPYKITCGKDGRWSTYLPDKDSGRKQIKKKNKEELISEIVSFWETEMYNPTIEEIFDEWNDRRLELKQISVSTHNRNRQCFCRHYAEFGKKHIKNTTWSEFEMFLEEQIAVHSLTAKAFSGLKGITKGFLQYAKKRNLFDYNVVTMMNELDVSEVQFKKTIKEDSEEVYDEEEFPVIMNYLVENLDTHNIGILLMFLTGLRIGELVALKHSDFENNTIKIRRTETRYSIDGQTIYGIKEFPKTKAGVRTAIIPESYMWLVKKIQLQNPFGEYVFVNSKGERMTTNCIRRRLELINRKLHIVKKSPHKIRKTYGTILLDNKVDNDLVTGVMGHSTILCTENHYHRNRKAIETKSRIISSIPEFVAIAK